MNAIWRPIDRFLRTSPFVRGLMERLGIDPVHYWLLMDLFGKLSERRELFSQLGRDGMSLQKASWLYYFLSGLMVLFFLAVRMALTTYFAIFLGLSAFLLFTTLLSETNNSLVNPVEGLMLAHQPINGATYTAAKLTHLLRILVHLVPGLNLIPALAGLLLKGCPWYYPLLHMAAAFAVGLVLALFCCALFGWLIRFVPPARLKAVGFAAEMSSWLFYMCFQFAGRLHVRLHTPHWLPTHAGPLRMLAAVVGAVAVTIVVLSIRALSGDYLVRVAAIAHGGSGAKSRVRRSRLGGLVARLFGGPSARAGFEYLSRMMLRDWQFRRQMIPLIPLAVMPLVAASQSVRVSPFSGKFTAVHAFPHAFGVAFYLICTVIVYGNDHQGAWLFLLAPAGAFRGFARGIYARLLTVILAPHLILLAVLAWYWGIRDAGLFVAYSAAVSAVYLGLELRLIEGIPFSRQPEASNNPFILPMMLLGGGAMGIAVGLQYFLIFHSAAAVLAVTLALCGVAWWVTRSSLEAFEVTIRFRLGMLSTESKGIYTEVDM
jgi:hypothetical protein